MAMDHNLYSQDLEGNIELRNDQFRWLFGRKYCKSYQKEKVMATNNTNLVCIILIVKKCY